MAWWQIGIECDRAELETVEDLLLELGAISITITDAQDEPIFEPLPGETPLWSKSILTGLFDQKRSLEELYDDLVKSLPEHKLGNIRKQQLDDQVWEREYLQHYQPLKFGNNLWIVPSWLETPEQDACNITLDPGLAFGTGSHPTTAMCLEYLDGHPPTHKTVLDYGCGSGILAIAAFKLGASSVSCVDIDPQALQATSDNAGRNGISSDQLSIALPDEQEIEPVEYLMANILSGPLMELEKEFSRLTLPGATLVLSGILVEQYQAVEQCYQRHFKLDPAKIDGDWVRLTGIRQ